MQSWKVGDVTITSVVESLTKLPAEFLFPQASAQAIEGISWLSPSFADEGGQIFLAVQALIVRTPDMLIVIDTCVGNDRKGRVLPFWNDLQTSFLNDLATAGVDRLKADVVLCTHLHPDHVGWNTMLQDGHWVPTFPNARYLIGKTEFEYWNSQRETAELSPVFEDSIDPILSAGLYAMVDEHHRICAEIALVPTPGHTPGHVSVQIESGSQKALITGDFIHHPCQMAHPEWMEVADTDPVQSETTRRAMLSDCADQPVLVVGTHFPSPAGGYVLRDGQAFRFES